MPKAAERSTGSESALLVMGIIEAVWKRVPSPKVSAWGPDAGGDLGQREPLNKTNPFYSQIRWSTITFKNVKTSPAKEYAEGFAHMNLQVFNNLVIYGSVTIT